MKKSLYDLKRVSTPLRKTHTTLLINSRSSSPIPPPETRITKVDYFGGGFQAAMTEVDPAKSRQSLRKVKAQLLQLQTRVAAEDDLVARETGGQGLEGLSVGRNRIVRVVGGVLSGRNPGDLTKEALAAQIGLDGAILRLRAIDMLASKCPPEFWTGN